MLVFAGCGGDDEADSAAGEPTAGEWKAWVPATTKLSVPAPPAEGSAAAKQDAADLKAAVEARTPRQERIARNYSTAPVVLPWLDTTMELVSRRPKDPPSSSRSYSYVSAAMQDAVIAAYRLKYKYKRDAPEGDSTRRDLVGPVVSVGARRDGGRRLEADRVPVPGVSGGAAERARRGRRAGARGGRRQLPHATSRRG